MQSVPRVAKGPQGGGFEARRSSESWNSRRQRDSTVAPPEERGRRVRSDVPQRPATDPKSRSKKTHGRFVPTRANNRWTLTERPRQESKEKPRSITQQSAGIDVSDKQQVRPLSDKGNVVDESELRVDKDGGIYTRNQFVQFYGGLAEWNEAVKLNPDAQTNSSAPTGGGAKAHKKKKSKASTKATKASQDRGKESKLREALKFSEEEVVVLRRAALKWVKQFDEMVKEIESLKAENVELRAELNHLRAPNSSSPPRSRNGRETRNAASLSVVDTAATDPDVQVPPKRLEVEAMLHASRRSKAVDSTRPPTLSEGPPPGLAAPRIEKDNGSLAGAHACEQRLDAMNAAVDLDAQKGEIEALQAIFQQDFKVVVAGSDKNDTEVQQQHTNRFRVVLDDGELAVACVK
mgnify:FL=1